MFLLLLPGGSDLEGALALDDGLLNDLGGVELGVPRAVEHPLDLVAVVDDGAGHLLGRAAEVGVGLELHVALDVLGVVDDRHLAVLVDPQLAQHDVVHHRLHLLTRTNQLEIQVDYQGRQSTHLSPGVVVARPLEDQVGNPQGLHLQPLALEFRPHAELL